MSVRITQCQHLRASPARVWQSVEDISTHPEWMHDAVVIAFLTEQHEGVGAEFTCLTRVGPFRTHDVLRVTEWEPGAVMGIAHTGVVEGSGRFTLTPDANGTAFCWEEVLRFPWWMGGPVGERVAKPLLGHVWRKNLQELKAIVERSAGPR